MTDNKRIAYNTIILYIKLLLSVVIGLYSSRLVLQALGSSDYGLYSVVGGIVSLLNIMGVTMVSTSYRYISVEIGKGDNGDPNRVFNTILVIHLFLAGILVLLGLIVGLWYIDNYLNVDVSKIPDAKFVLIISMISTVGTIISIPFRGLIIAREKFLFTSIVESLQLLLKVFLIVIWLKSYDGNRLRLFSEIMLLISLIPVLAYYAYCYIYDGKIVKWEFINQKEYYHSIFSFSGWMLLSTLSFMGLNQGMAMIMNVFWGTVINASFSIANQVQSYIQMFPKNIIQASRPQIMKRFAEGNEAGALSLVYYSTKYCFFSLWLLAFPFLLFVDKILMVWLENVPPFTSLFTSFILISTIVGSLTNGFDSLILATGKIRMSQFTYAILNLLQLPIVYCAYHFGAPAYFNTILMIVLNVVSVICQICIIKKVSIFNLKHYFRYTIKPVLYIIIFSMPLLMIRIFEGGEHFIVILLFIVLSCIWILCGIYMYGLTNEERAYFMKEISRILKK